MLASLLPGLRELRAPLAAGYVWLIAAWIGLEPHVEKRSASPTGLVGSFYSLLDAASAVGLGIAVSFAAYLVGLISVGSLNPVLRRFRPGLSDKSRLALDELVVGVLQRVDARLAGSPTSLRRLVLDETERSTGEARVGRLHRLLRHEPSRGAQGGDLVRRIADRVEGELDLVRTRLLNEKPELFSTADRQRAEGEFRLAVVPPIGALAVVAAAVGGTTGIVFAVVLVPAALALYAHGIAADRAAADVLVLALVDDHVQAPTLQRLDEASKGGLPEDAQERPRVRPEEVLKATVKALGSALDVLDRLRAGGTGDATLAQVTEQARDQLARLAVYMRRSERLTETIENADARLDEATARLREGEPVPEEEVKALREEARQIEWLATVALTAPGLYEELAGDLARLREALAGESKLRRVVAVQALGGFLGPGKDDVGLAVLADAARSEDDDVAQAAARHFERCSTQSLDGLLRQSWQNARFPGLELPGANLTGIDLRDAHLENANLSGAVLQSAALHNARLNGAALDNAALWVAALDHTDLAGASIEGASLSGATLTGCGVEGLRMSGADLAHANLDPGEIPWHLTHGWRHAKLSDDDRAVAIELGGAEPEGPRILMPMWEVPPFVAGGSWTACYHLVRRLRARGADVTVVVPWSDGLCAEHPFATEVEVVHLGIHPTGPGGDPYAAPPGSPYDWRAYGAGVGVYGYGGYGGYGGSPELVPVIDEFASRLTAWRRLQEFELIHAQDWVTFTAAELASRTSGRPWIAHFHSTANERHPDGTRATYWEREVERRAAERADRVLAPSAVTARVIQEEYGASDVRVVPNPISREPVVRDPMGSFDTKRVVFVGRLTAQKAPNRFVEIARAAHEIPETSSWEFVAYGDGDERERLTADAGDLVEFAGPLEWAERDAAFRSASAVVVPSRAEPFGMVILEAMERGVPVIYPTHSGFAGATESWYFEDTPDVADPHEVLGALSGLLGDEGAWSKRAGSQLNLVDTYRAAEHEQGVVSVWETLLAERAPR